MTRPKEFTKEQRRLLPLTAGIATACRLICLKDEKARYCHDDSCPIKESFNAANEWWKMSFGRTSEAILLFCFNQCGELYPRCSEDKCPMFNARRVALKGYEKGTDWTVEMFSK